MCRSNMAAWRAATSSRAAWRRGRARIYVASLDGRLIALDAGTGKPVWSTLTVDDSDRAYTITGAPRVYDGKVIIGNGGAEQGVRGYVSAYDAETGRMLWRFFTVPGDPAKGFENKAMEMAAKTWNGQWWKPGGGGTVWDSVAYDPALHLLMWAWAMARPGRRNFAVLAAGTICSSPPSSRSTWIQANMSGIIRRRRAKSGIIPPRSR